MHVIIEDLYIHYTYIPSSDSINFVCLWLHGWQQQGSTFHDLIKLLPDYGHLVVDLPGFGKSTIPHTTRGIPDYAQLIKTFLVKVVPEKEYIILGHSFGGRIAIELASTSNLVNKLVLLGSAGIPPKRSFFSHCIDVFSPLLGGLKRFSGLRKIISFFGNKLRSSDYLHAGAMEDTFLQTIRYDQTLQLSQITIPSLLIRGDQDDQTPFLDAQKMHRLIKNSSLHILPGTHFLYLEESEQISRLIKMFIAS